MTAIKDHPDQHFHQEVGRKNRVYSYLNCSLSPEPESLVSFAFAVNEAMINGVFSRIDIKKATSIGMMGGNVGVAKVIADPTFTHLFSAADDAIMPSNTIVKLIEDDKDVVGGLYEIRREGDFLASQTLAEAAGGPPNSISGEDSLEECVFSGSHAMLIKREVLVKMAQDNPELLCVLPDNSVLYALFMPLIIDHSLYLDDMGFCYLARKSGFRVWRDNSVRLIHHNEYWKRIPDGKMPGPDGIEIRRKE